MAIQLELVRRRALHLKKPVLIFVHGGAFQQGTACEPPFNGAKLSAALNIVVATFNYRLGILGFFHPTEEKRDGKLSGSSVETNVGIRDQELAFEWVQKYIEFFGGNTENITLWYVAMA